MAIGRISGPLLKANLIREGADLAFETNLLYLDVNNRRIGVKTSSPQADLDVNGILRSTNVQVDNSLTVGTFTFTGNSITSTSGTINFAASANEATIYHARLLVDDFQLQGNRISTTVSNSSIEIDPNGTGTIELQANTNVTGNLSVSGDVSAIGNVVIGGNIIIGDEITDTITINASIKSDLIPEVDNTYDLGTPSLRWRAVYAGNFYTTALNTPELDIGDLQFRDNEITSSLGQDIVIDGTGTGGVRLANFRIVDNVITNIVSGAISVIQQSGTGYFRIATTNGFVPPVGNNAQRPTAYAVEGMTRYNTESKALEIWDGFTWASPAGTAGSVNFTQAEDISVQWALTLG